jgi:multidrug efflux system membrane fusion protein
MQEAQESKTGRAQALEAQLVPFQREGHEPVVPPRKPVEDGEDEAVEEIPRQRKGKATLWVLGLIALGLGATLVLDRAPQQENRPGEQAAQPAPVPVTVAEVTTNNVPVYFDGLGVVQASNTVAVHSQVDGKLQSVNFVEGQHVKKGEVLAVVDPRSFQAALDQANAKKAQDQAQLISDEKDLARFQDLLKKGAGTQQSADQQQAKVDALKATIEADQAGIDSAATQLSYVTITSPIDGRVGFRQVDAGNIVHASDQTPITVLTDLTPTNVIFMLPQRDLAIVRDAMAKGDVTVVAMDQDNVYELAKGKLLLIDNQIDQTTSTLRLKASFPNENERLWPGQFIRARVLVNTLKDAVTIPSAAVQRNSQGLLAWVITPDNTAEIRLIAGGPSHDDGTVVTSGLKPGERVVVNGQYRLRPGAKVEVGSPEAPMAEAGKPEVTGTAGP